MAGSQSVVEDWQPVSKDADDWTDIKTSHGTGTVADRHNNPLNIKYGQLTSHYVDSGSAEVGEAAKDGGNFLRFTSPDEGFQAARELLTSPKYIDQDIESAMRAWSGNGYGADVVPGIDKDRPVSSLNAEELDSLIHGMAKREGYGGEDWQNVTPVAAPPKLGPDRPYVQKPLTSAGQRGMPPRPATPELARRGAPPPVPATPLAPDTTTPEQPLPPSLTQPISKTLGGKTFQETAEQAFPKQPLMGATSYVRELNRFGLQSVAGVLDWMQTPLGLATAIGHAATEGADAVIMPILGPKFTKDAYDGARAAVEDMVKNGASVENVEQLVSSALMGAGAVAGAKQSEILKPQAELRKTITAAQELQGPVTERAKAVVAEEPTMNQAARRATIEVPETTVQDEQHFTDAELEELTRPEPKAQPIPESPIPSQSIPKPPTEETPVETPRAEISAESPIAAQAAEPAKTAIGQPVLDWETVQEAPERPVEQSGVPEAVPEPERVPAVNVEKPAAEIKEEPRRESTIATLQADVDALTFHEARGVQLKLQERGKDAPGKLREAFEKAPDPVAADYLTKLREAAETHLPSAVEDVEHAESLMADGKRGDAATAAEVARKALSDERQRQLVVGEAEKQGYELPADLKKPKPPKRAPAAPEPQPQTERERHIWDGAESEMRLWAESAREAQNQLKRGESAQTMESNAAGKEIEEKATERASAIKSLGVKEGSVLEHFEEDPQTLMEAIEDRGGKFRDSKKMKLYKEIQRAFRDQYETDHGDAIDAMLAKQEQEAAGGGLFGEGEQGHTFEEGTTESGLGRTEEEGMRKLVGGRKIEQLKESKAFDEQGLINSELFGGKGGAQRELGEAAEEEGGDTSFDFNKAAVQSRSLQELGQGASDAARSVKDSVRQTFVPTGGGESAKTMGLIVRRGAAELAARDLAAGRALKAARRYFTKLPEDRQLDFIDAMETGDLKSLPEKERGFAQTMRRLLDDTWAEVRKRSGTRSVIENYFPHLWADPAKATEVMRKYYARRPLEGGKGFLKQREIMSVREGIEAGLKLADTNPVQTVLAQLHQENKFITGRDMVEEMKQQGVIRFKSVFDRTRAGEKMAKIDDPIGTVYGAPTIKVKEAYDEIMFHQLNDFAASLGIQHFRQYSIGKQADVWGYTRENSNKVFTKAGGPETILTHELGHQLDYRYGLKDRLAKRGETSNELRALADLRYAGREDLTDDAYKQYVRKGSEKIANLIHAMIHAPELAEEVAPNSVQSIRELAMLNPELRPLLDIKPSLVIGTAEHEAPVGGMVIKGHWWAPEPAARVINNYLGPGLSGNVAFDFMRATGNLLNQVQLGASAFHFTFTALDSASSMFAAGVQDIAAGRFKRGLGRVAGGNILYAPWATAVEGSKILREFYKPGSQGELYAKIIDDVKKGGGRFEGGAMYRNNAVEKFFDAWGKKDFIGAGLRSVPAAIELAAKPIMEYWVPRQKLGAFSMLSQQMLEDLGPQADPMLVRKTLARAWDAVDDRMGQLVYDNLFWSRTTKDAGMVAVRSLGWNIGTWRHFGGAAVDVAQAARGGGAAFESGQFRLTPRMTYALTFPVVIALHGAMAMYLMSGKRPQTLEDYFFPQTGKLTPTGEPERVSLPSYAKDLYAYGRDFPGSTLEALGHKAHPDISLVMDMLRNKDFYGTEIRHEDDPKVQQLKDAMLYIGKQYVPFSARNLTQRLGTEGVKDTAAEALKHPGTAAASFFGMVPAPKVLEQTPAERLAMRYAGEERPEGGRTKVQFERAQTRNLIIRAFQAKDPTAAQQQSEALKAGKLAPSDLRTILEEKNKTPLQRYLRSANLEQLLNVWDQASSTEKKQLRPMIARARNSDSLTLAEKVRLKPRADKARDEDLR